MENGVGAVNGSHLGERKVDDDRAFAERIEARVLDGSEGSKEDLEEDEVFEEAIEQLQDQPAEPDSDEIAIVEQGNVEGGENLDSVVIDGNSGVGHEADTFQEAIGVPGEVGVQEEELLVSVDEKVGGLVDSGEAVYEVLQADRVGGEVAVKEVANSESNGLMGDGEDDGMEASNVADYGETEASKDVGENAGIVLEKSGNVGLGDVSTEGAIGPEISEEINGNIWHQDEKSEDAKDDSLDDQDKDEEIGPGIQSENLDDNGWKLNGLNNFDSEHKDGETCELKFAPACTESGDAEGEEVKDSLVKLDSDYPDKSKKLIEDAIFTELCDYPDKSKTLIEDANFTELCDYPDKSKKLIEDANFTELKDTLTMLESDHQGESRELKDTSASLASGNRGDNRGGEGLSNLNSEHQSDKNEGMKYTSGSNDTEGNGESCKQSGISGNLYAPAEDGKASPERGSSNLLEDSSIVKRVTTPTSGTEDSKGSQPQITGENIVEVRNLRAVSEVPVKKEASVKEENKSILGNREQEVRPAIEVVSSSTKSSNPAPSPARPAGLGRAAPLLEPAPRVAQQPRVNGNVSQMQSQLIEESTNGEAEETDETREKLQMIRVKFLRLAHRLGQTPHNVVVAQVLYRLGLAEQLRGRNGGRVGAFSFDRASAMAEQLEAAGQEPLDFTCTIMVLGKTGVGKSATINSIFDEVKFGTDAFQFGTKKVQDVVGTVQGIKVRVIDTPGLLPSWSDQRQNEKILHSVKRFIKKTPPDIVLYLDRLDMQSRDFGDMPLLRTITDIFGPSIWFNAIVVLTHAASAPPDGPNGTASSYDMFVTQRSHVVQQAIRQAAGDMRLMNPVSLVENHSACRTNRAGQRVLPNGQVWKPHLLLLSFASKILAEANTLLKLQDSPPGKPFATRTRAPPLPFLLSSLLQSRPQLKLPEEQYGDEDNLDDEFDESSDSEDESEYDELPPFKRLTKAQLEKLTKAQKKAYFDELEYREKLFMKKQLKEERRRRRMMKKLAAAAKDLPSEYSDNVEEESSGAASVPVPMPDLALPAAFDSDNPTHRYRYLDNSNQWLVRPVLETHGWDHDVGYEGINVERLFVVKEKVPLSFSGQITKDKKDANLQMEVASSIKHGEGKVTSLGLDMQSVGKDMAYTLRGETKFSNYRHNKATAGLSVTLLGDALSAGVKLEDKLIANKRFKVVMSGGAMTGRGDVAYGGSLEATLRDKDYPLGRSLSTLGLSVMDWHGDLAIGCNIQSQIPVGRYTNLIARGNLNNRGSGQISIRLNSSEQLQIALIGFLPLLRKLLGYSQQMQFGQ